MRATTASGCRTASPGARTTRRCISPTATCTRSSPTTTISRAGAIGKRRVFADTKDRPACRTARRSTRKGFSGPRCSTARASRATRRTGGSTAPCRCRSAARPPARSAAPDLRTMYVTTARFRLAPDKLAREPHAGGLLALDVGVKGPAGADVAAVTIRRGAEAVQRQLRVDIVEHDLDALRRSRLIRRRPGSR